MHLDNTAAFRPGRLFSELHDRRMLVGRKSADQDENPRLLARVICNHGSRGWTSLLHDLNPRRILRTAPGRQRSRRCNAPRTWTRGWQLVCGVDYYTGGPARFSENHSECQITEP